VANAGHGRREIVDAIVKQAKHRLLHNYCFPSEIRSLLVERLVKLAPKEMDKCFVLTTGAETTECAIKLARTYGQTVGGTKKIGIVSFHKSFHGRTLGAQMIGGIPALKEWIVNLDPAMWQAPFPDGYWCEDTSFGGFLKALKRKRITPGRVAGVITETYQGGGASFMPADFVQKLAEWCEKHDIVLIMDEIQAGFGRTGKKFGFEHYSIVPDLVCCGKGITSSLPLSAVIGRGDLMDQYPPGSMTSTHTGSPLCCAAALANIEVLERERLWEHAAKMGDILHEELGKLQKKYPKVIGAVHGKGLVGGLHIVKNGKKVANPDLAFDIIERCVQKGLLFFSPVGRATVKISPPLVVNEEQICEGAAVLDDAIAEG
jgi:4-aminobutyrate aminotransferase/diaminobutyrate-pyruvate transaminase/4-aminobutyrate aminotransferase/(S)-3-amino-2-methylpropionate transaminase